MTGIVVGFDGSPPAEAALAFALEEARLRKLPLRIVYAWEIPSIEYAGVAVTPTPDLAAEAEHHVAGACLPQRWAAERVNPPRCSPLTLTSTSLPAC
jgi:nucleotide-binding universal stress UspA family protein